MFGAIDANHDHFHPDLDSFSRLPCDERPTLLEKAARPDQHWYRGPPHNVFRNRPQKQAGERAVATPSDHDHVRAQRLGETHGLVQFASEGSGQLVADKPMMVAAASWAGPERSPPSE